MRCTDIYLKYKDKIIEAVPRYLRRIPESGEVGVSVERDIGAYTQYPEATALLGRTLAETGLQFYKMLDISIANSQLDQFELNAETKYNKLLADLSTNPDPVTYEESLRKVIEDIQNKDLSKVTHPLAKQKAGLWFAQRMARKNEQGQDVAGEWLKDIRIAAGRKAAQNAKETFEVTYKTAIDLGNESMLIASVARAQESGSLSDELAEIYLAGGMQEINKAKTLDAALQIWRTTGDIKKADELIDATDTLITLNKTRVKKDLKDIVAQNDIDEARTYDAWQNQQDAQSQKLWQAGNFVEGKKFIENAESGIASKQTEQSKWKQDWSNIFNSGLSGKTIIDDEPLRAELYGNALSLARGTMTKEEFYKKLNDNRDKFTPETYRFLATTAENNIKDPDPLNNPGIKRMMEAVDKWRDTGFFVGKSVSEMTPEEYDQNLSKWFEHTSEIEQWAKKYPDATPKQQQEFFDDLFKKPKEEAAKGWLGRWWEKYMAVEGEGVVHRRRRLAKEPILGEISGEPKTQSEFEFEVYRLSQIDNKKAREYYDKWANKWQ